MNAAGEVVAAIEAGGGQAFALGQPFGTDGDVDALFAQLDQELLLRTGSTRLEIVVNNAGIALHGGLADTTSANAPRAARTAASTSSAPARGGSPTPAPITPVRG